MLIFREMFGLLRRDAPYVYVSDGGHNDNLGLVELFRRGCGEIWCIDSSGDPPGVPRTLSDALLAATAELGLQCDIDLNQLALDEQASAKKATKVKSVFVSGTYKLPRRDSRGSIDGTLHVVKLGVDASTPSMLQLFQNRRPSFPYDPTRNQVYNADLFDAYRALGYASTNDAIQSRRTERHQPAEHWRNDVSRRTTTIRTPLR